MRALFKHNKESLVWHQSSLHEKGGNRFKVQNVTVGETQSPSQTALVGWTVEQSTQNFGIYAQELLHSQNWNASGEHTPQSKLDEFTSTGDAVTLGTQAGLCTQI